MTIIKGIIRSIRWFIIIESRMRVSNMGQEFIISIINIVEECLVNTSDEFTLAASLETRARVIARARGTRTFGCKALFGAAIQNKRAVPDAEIIVILCRM